MEEKEKSNYEFLVCRVNTKNRKDADCFNFESLTTWNEFLRAQKEQYENTSNHG